MKKTILVLCMFVFLGLNLSAESPQSDLPSTRTEVTLSEQMMIPEISPEIEAEHDLIIPDPEWAQSDLYFFLIPQRFSFELPAFSSSSLKLEEKKASPYLLGIADFRSSEEAWTVSVSIRHDLAFDAIYSIAWETEAKAFYGLNDDNQVVIDLEQSFVEENIQTERLEYYLQDANSQKHFAQSKGSLYGFYVLSLEKMMLFVDAYTSANKPEDEHFLLEWTLSTDLRIDQNN